MPPTERDEPKVDPHAGHTMPAADGAPAEASHAEHSMPPAGRDETKVDPHAGHAMPEPNDTKTTEPSEDDSAEDEATHDHGDTP